MAPFFESCWPGSLRRRPAPLHILHFGDSHTAADEWTGGMRYFFQQKFGNGGSGFLLAGHPFLATAASELGMARTPGWHSEGLSVGRRRRLFRAWGA